MIVNDGTEEAGSSLFIQHLRLEFSFPILFYSILVVFGKPSFYDFRLMK